MKLSFIIPLYNAEKYIEQCLSSIHNQSMILNDYEVIVIDDGSSDNGILKARKIAKEYSNMVVYHQENKGVSATRNRGIDLAKGDYIWFIDSDDYIISDTANILLSIAEKYDLDILEFKMVRTESRTLNKTFLGKKNSKQQISIYSGKEYAALIDLNDSTCTNLYKRQFLINTKIRFIEGKVMEDMTFNAEVFPKSNKIAYFPLDAYRYVINPNSIWTNKESKALRKSIEDFIFMTIKFNHFISEYKKNNIGTSIIETKQQNMLFNISKRLLTSDFKISEINNKIKELSQNNLYPIHPFKGKEFYRKLETFVFNRKYLFLLSVFIYRIFKRPIDYFVIKKYQRNKEKHIKNTIVNF
ncbi:glycosyltransferase [Aureibaculum luteum]|uniref:glycosyltransferase n=1 Tax=Aureibaculum luteum TaxID=1548456 RepID=UPI000E540E57|nr:glycosyltransferase [Aureibaculum luteum]